MESRRKVYKMTEEDLQEMLRACKSTKPQEKTDKIWQRLGKRMGFVCSTVRATSVHYKNHFFFSAIPSENKTQRQVRLKKEKIEERLAKIKRLSKEIQERQVELDKIRQELTSMGWKGGEK